MNISENNIVKIALTLSTIFTNIFYSLFPDSINPNMVQRETIVLVGVVLDRSTPESFAEFERAAKQLNNVLECYLVAGEVDYFLKIRVKDLVAFNRFHSEKIIALPGVRQVRTFFVLNEVTSDGLLTF